MTNNSNFFTSPTQPVAVWTQPVAVWTGNTNIQSITPAEGGDTVNAQTQSVAVLAQNNNVQKDKGTIR